MYAGYTETQEQVKARWKMMQRRAAKKAKRTRPAPAKKAGG